MNAIALRRSEREKSVVQTARLPSSESQMFSNTVWST